MSRQPMDRRGVHINENKCNLLKIQLCTIISIFIFIINIIIIKTSSFPRNDLLRFHILHFPSSQEGDTVVKKKINIKTENDLFSSSSQSLKFHNFLMGIVIYDSGSEVFL
ncbi:hypothetical protein H8356DRAFT_1420009 [Neocallimastix lanati (nom. inval.)]|nr:hypothetical protein H8356DRAFT_1420009 [Neocallimastix sp. JGI-2020a]